MEKNRKQIVVFCLEIIAMTLLYTILDLAGIYKYMVVIASGLALFLWKRNNICQLKEDGYLLIPAMIYCGIGLCLSVFGGNQTFWTIKTVAFWMIPPLFALLLGMAYDSNRSHMVDIQFYGALLSYLATKGGYILLVGEWESAFAFVFGLFGIYYVWRHRWIAAAAAMIGMHFANKRIAVFAVVLCLILMLFLKLVKYSEKWIAALWIMLMTTVGVYLYGIFSGAFAVLCERFQIDTMTRVDMYAQIAEKVPGFRWLGQGLGAVNEMLAGMLSAEVFNRWYENPHNDFLKIYLELGALGLFLFLASYLIIFYIAGKKGIERRALSQLFIIVTYFMMLMTTDNVSIYILFLVPMYSICLALMGENCAGS